MAGLSPGRHESTGDRSRIETNGPIDWLTSQLALASEASEAGDCFSSSAQADCVAGLGRQRPVGLEAAVGRSNSDDV
jgi:hypothetical protein